MWDGIKGFREVQQNNVALLAMVQVSSKFFEGDEQMGFTLMVFTKTMLRIRQNLKLLKVQRNVSKYNMFYDFTGNRSEGDGSVLRGK